MGAVSRGSKPVLTQATNCRRITSKPPIAQLMPHVPPEGFSDTVDVLFRTGGSAIVNNRQIARHMEVVSDVESTVTRAQEVEQLGVRCAAQRPRAAVRARPRSELRSGESSGVASGSKSSAAGPPYFGASSLTRAGHWTIGEEVPISVPGVVFHQRRVRSVSSRSTYPAVSPDRGLIQGLIQDPDPTVLRSETLTDSPHTQHYNPQGPSPRSILRSNSLQRPPSAVQSSAPEASAASVPRAPLTPPRRSRMNRALLEQLLLRQPSLSPEPSRAPTPIAVERTNAPHDNKQHATPLSLYTWQTASIHI